MGDKRRIAGVHANGSDVVGKVVNANGSWINGPSFTLAGEVFDLERVQ